MFPGFIKGYQLKERGEYNLFLIGFADSANMPDLYKNLFIHYYFKEDKTPPFNECLKCLSQSLILTSQFRLL